MQVAGSPAKENTRTTAKRKTQGAASLERPKKIYRKTTFGVPQASNLVFQFQTGVDGNYDDLTQVLSELKRMNATDKQVVKNVISDYFQPDSILPTDSNEQKRKKRFFDLQVQKLSALLDMDLKGLSVLNMEQLLATDIDKFQKNEKTGTSPISRIAPKMTLSKAKRIMNITGILTKDLVMKRFRKLALKVHPNKHPSKSEKYEELFKELAAAKDLLLQEIKRGVKVRAGAPPKPKTTIKKLHKKRR